MKSFQLFLAAILTTALCSAAFGQTSSYEVGLEGGPTRTVLRGDWTANPAIQYSGGLSFQYNLSDLFSFRTGVAFEQKSDGGIIEESDGTKSGKAFLHFQYLTVPLLARFTFGNKVRFFVNAGPYGGYLMQARSVIKPADSSGLSEEEDDLSVFYKSFDAGVTAGIGSSMRLHERVLLSLELRNSLGLLNVSDTSLLVKVNSTSLLLGGAYLFGKGNSGIK